MLEQAHDCPPQCPVRRPRAIWNTYPDGMEGMWTMEGAEGAADGEADPRGSEGVGCK